MQAEQIHPDEMPKTLMQAVRYFADLALCEKYFASILNGGAGPLCPTCGAGGDKITELTTRPKFKCRDCQLQFSRRLGTILYDSPLPTGHWFVAMWCIANGDLVSSPMLADALDIQQHSAWSLLTRVREASQLTH